MINILDFRESFFPYLGLIVSIVVLVAVIIPAILLHHKKTLFWSIGNLLGFYVSWLVLFFAERSISAVLIKFIIPSGVDIDSTTFIPMFNQIIAVIWFAPFLLIWNVMILLPNYFAWYKKAVGLKNIKPLKHKNKHEHKHHARIKSGMVVLSIITYAPIIICAGTAVQSITVSQANANRHMKGLDQAFNTASIITYVNQTQVNLDALQALNKVYTANVDTPDGTKKHPYEFLKDGFDNFFLFSATDATGFRTWINTNFQIDNDINSEEHNVYYYVKWLDADYLGKQFYGERTVSSMLSQLMLPITVGTAVSDLLASFLKVDSINYQEITTPSIQTDYSQGSQDNKISLRDFLSTLLTGSKQEIRVPNAEDQSITDVYHLSLFKNNKSVDFRIKVLVETYDNLCHKIAKEIISHDEDTSEYDNMVELTKNCLGKIFFIDHAPNGTKYTNALQISDSF